MSRIILASPVGLTDDMLYPLVVNVESAKAAAVRYVLTDWATIDQAAKTRVTLRLSAELE